MPTTRMPRAALAILVLLGLTRCSPASVASETTRQEKVAGCAKAGDRCEFSPGKIGLCTAQEGTIALTCVSLH